MGAPGGLKFYVNFNLTFTSIWTPFRQLRPGAFLGRVFEGGSGWFKAVHGGPRTGRSAQGPNLGTFCFPGLRRSPFGALSKLPGNPSERPPVEPPHGSDAGSQRAGPMRGVFQLEGLGFRV